MTMGEKIKDNLTGEVFEVKKIVKERELLRDEPPTMSDGIEPF